jgi:ribonuclease HII
MAGLKSFYDRNIELECGCDEAGRGCLAGPVYAAAVILPKKYRNKHFNDSKKLSAETRYELRPVIEEKAIAWAVGIASREEIDQLNILHASILAMHRAIAQLKIKPEFLLIDGNRFHAYPKIAHKCIVEGDAKFLSIAAASILAKTYRDDFMKKAAESYPHYAWHTNVGYGTREHREAIREHGLCDLHRMSFTHIPDNQLELELD